MMKENRKERRGGESAIPSWMLLCRTAIQINKKAFLKQTQHTIHNIFDYRYFILQPSFHRNQPKIQSSNYPTNQ